MQLQGMAIRLDGWYENEDLSGQACTVIASGSTGPKTFYAKWTAKTYRVTLETNGGTIVGSGLTEYTCGQGAELPTNVEKSGYTFAGWYENDRFEGSAVTGTAIRSTATNDLLMPKVDVKRRTASHSIPTAAR